MGVEGHEREALERLLRYMLRPPFAHERIRQREDGRYEYELRRPWTNGAVSVVLDGVELMEKLAALIPGPRETDIVYHGVWAPNAKMRGRIVPAGGKKGGEKEGEEKGGSWIAWAELKKRVFGIDELTCERCGGGMKIVAYVRSARGVRRYLEGVGQAAEGPRRMPARDPPQLELWPRGAAEEESDGSAI